MNGTDTAEAQPDAAAPELPPIASLEPATTTASIFRETALQRLSSPEQLDQLIHVTSPKTWIALATSLALLVAVLLWGIFGTIPLRVHASGVLVDREGKLYAATAQAAGLVTQILVSAEDKVRAGQVIAMLDAPDLQQQLIGAQKFLDKLIDMRRGLVAAEATERERRRVLLENRAAATRGSAAPHDHLTDDDREDLAFENGWRDRLMELDLRIAAQGGQVDELQARLDHATLVRSPVDGVVVQISGAVGAMTALGARIATITTKAKKTDALVFLPVDSYARVSSGMPALVTPATVDQAEYGSIVARVFLVDNYPSDRQTIAAIVQDEALAERISRRGSVFAVRIELAESSDTSSGFRWSTTEGPPFSISQGTPASAWITTRHERPINLVVPALGKLLGH
jgi:HlyD family secretion protein